MTDISRERQKQEGQRAGREGGKLKSKKLGKTEKD